MSPIYCNQCRHPNTADARFCAKCGREVSATSRQTSDTAALTPGVPKVRTPRRGIWVAGGVVLVGAIAALLVAMRASSKETDARSIQIDLEGRRIQELYWAKARAAEAADKTKPTPVVATAAAPPAAVGSVCCFHGHGESQWDCVDPSQCWTNQPTYEPSPNNTCDPRTPNACPSR